ncbi:tRNA (guanosine(37)-N1)-methyltransferase TrmD, partial [Lactobacillus salivarius]|nr:tRNA (guanosine(37)-N1)-methyltransferase TrmD [Ligilactobacillus salivarius]
PQYTRPSNFRGMEVPEVLLSGNHQKIAEWRKKESLRRTYQRRPDLLENYKFSDREKEWLREFERDKDVEIHGKG